ncbi:MAG: patatin-like phospholipase family protein [Chloroflexi bacterium]|nr:patatin-like phospholipase family protein [Chloroflexota bacterium]
MSQNRLKVGLALGSGSSRGLAHIGVLCVLEKEDIPIDLIAGTSAGAIVGAPYAFGFKAEGIKKTVNNFSLIEKARMIDIALPKTGLISGNKIKNMLKSFIGDVEFKDLKVPFACVATDIISGTEVVLKEGSVVEAVRASISIPGIFTVVKSNGRYLVDGGIVNPVPVSVCREMGADIVIAVNVMPPPHKMHNNTKKAPDIFHVIINTVDIANAGLIKDSLEQADIIINPETQDYKQTDFRHVGELIKKGEEATLEAIPRIKELLKLHHTRSG